MAPTKLASKTRKVKTPEVTEQFNPVVPQPGPARRSRAATKSTEFTESEPTEPSKPTRKTTTRGTKTGAASEADAETEAEPSKSGLRRVTRTRSQSVEVQAPAPAPTTTKRRVRAKSKKAADVTLETPAEDGPDLSLAEHPKVPPAGAKSKSTAKTGAVRGRRGKTKVAAAEMEDESTGTDAVTGTLRVAPRGRRTPTANVGTTTGTAAGAASNRATTVTATTAGKGRVVARVGVGASSGKSAARTVGEKENTPERIHVKEEEPETVPLPSGAVAAKGGRGARKGTTTAAAPKALSEPEKDVTARYPRCFRWWVE